MLYQVRKKRRFLSTARKSYVTFTSGLKKKGGSSKASVAETSIYRLV